MNASREQFIEELFKLHFQPLLKYGLSLVGYDRQFYFCVEECVQETFIAAYESYERLTSHPNVGGWLRIALKNRIMQRMKKERVNVSRNQSWEEVSFKADVAEEDEIERLLHHEHCKQLVEHALSKLKSKERDIIIQYYFKRKSVREIAASHHTSQNVIKVQLHRIRQKIKTFLGSLYFLLTLLFILTL